MKTNYNSSATGGNSTLVAPERASRQSFFFKSLGAVFTLNFGATATADNVLTINSNESIVLNKQSPYDICTAIYVYSAGNAEFQAQAEE